MMIESIIDLFCQMELISTDKWHPIRECGSTLYRSIARCSCCCFHMNVVPMQLSRGVVSYSTEDFIANFMGAEVSEALIAKFHGVFRAGL